ALDSASGEAVMTLLHELNAEGATIAVITHDTEIAGRLPRQVRIRDGRVVEDTSLGSDGAGASDGADASGASDGAGASSASGRTGTSGDGRVAA
ncbi:ABC transporter ATP-binding protein, partial [Streptomyces massasporeus]